MNAVTQITETALYAAVTHYDVGELTDYWPAANGIENSNFFVDTDDGGRRRHFVLTIMEQHPNAGDAYVAMMDALEARGLPVAPPLATRHGTRIETIDAKPAMLQTRLAGKHVHNPTTRQVCSLGKFVGRMHTAMAGTSIALPDYPRTGAWLQTQADALRGYVGYREGVLLGDCADAVGAMLDRKDCRELPRGMIHADLFRDNVLFNERGLCGVLDFHHAATGYWLYDLAVIANDWCTDVNGVLDAERTVALLRAYHIERAMQPHEFWLFPTMLLYAAQVFWVSRLQAKVEARKSPVRVKNPDEFRRIVQQHLRHPFYFDERLVLDAS